MDSNNREVTSLQESIDTTQLTAYRAAIQALMEIVRHLKTWQRRSPPVTIDLKRGQQKYQQYSQGLESQNPSDRAMAAARRAHSKGESPDVVISLVRASPAGESMAGSQSSAHADLAAAQIAHEAVRQNVQRQRLQNNPALARSLKAKPIRTSRVSRCR